MTTTWIYGRWQDTAIAWGWVPVFAATHVLAGQASPAGDSAVTALLAGVLLLSLVHQPLTLLLVYGDGRRFALRRRFFVWTPLIALPVVAVAVLADLWLLVPIAAVWQVVHTQQQRYGLLRMYARRTGHGSAARDRALTWIPFVTAVVATAVLPASLDQLDRFGRALGADSNSALQLLLDARPLLVWLLVPLVALTAAVVRLYVRQEAGAPSRNPATWSYALAGAALSVGLVVDPVAGLAASVAAHAVEYTIVVHGTLATRYGPPPAARTSPLARAARTAGGRTALLTGVLGLVAVADVGLRGVVPDRAHLIALYTIGLLHFVYDAVIWKTRRPATLPSPAPTP